MQTRHLSVILSTIVSCLFIFGMAGRQTDSTVGRASASTSNTITVTSPADSGAGTLRQAILDAQSGDTILFDAAVFPPTNPATIALTSGGLPNLSQGGVTIDASNAGVILDGGQLGSLQESTYLDNVELWIDGVDIIENGGFTSGLDHWVSFDDKPGHTRLLSTQEYVSAPQSLQIVSSAQAWDAYTYYDPTGGRGLLTDRPDDDLRSPVWIQVQPGQQIELSVKHNSKAGLFTSILARHGDWVGNLANKESEWADDGWQELNVSGTTYSGINAVAVELRTRHSMRWISGLYINSDNNTVRGLQIVNFTGDGISLRKGASGNTVGGDRTIGSGPQGQGNRVAGCGALGIALWHEGTTNNLIVGNWVGLDASGQNANGNRYEGIRVSYGADHNTIGGRSLGQRNVIAGNLGVGIILGTWGQQTSHNIVLGNYIGTRADGTGFLPNKLSGIEIGADGHDNIIGGSEPGAGNLITASGNEGIRINGDNNHILGNRIGLDIDGTRDVRVSQLAFSPSYQIDKTIFVGTGSPGDLGTGIYRSTDGGQAWQQVNNGLGNQQITALAISPGYATDQTIFAGSKDGLYRSLDGGASWTDVTPNSADRNILSLAISAKFGTNRYVYFGNNPVWTGTEYSGGLYRSFDDGITWTDLNLSAVNARAKESRPALVNVPAMGGTELLQFARQQAGLVAEDRPDILSPAEAEVVTAILGSTWRPGLAVAIPPIFAPAMNGTVFVGTTASAGSLFRSDDYGNSFSPANTGLDSYDVGRIAIPPDYTVPNLTLYVTNSTGEGAYPKRSTDNGASWLALTNGIVPDQAKPVDIAFGGSNTLWLTYTYRWPSIIGVYKSTDRGDTWTLPNPNIDRNVKWLTALEMAPDGVLWQATMMDGLLRSTDGGATWDFANGNLTERGNRGHGIVVWGRGNVIGGDGDGDRNIIANNGAVGLGLWGSGVYSTTITGNYIGIDADGQTSMGNADTGIQLGDGSYDNLVNNNVVASNPWGGIQLNNTRNNTFSHNILGANATGDKALPQYRGMSLYGGAEQNMIIDNQIAGNWFHEIGVLFGAADNTLKRNNIGASADRTKGLNSNSVGISIDRDPTNTVIGGPSKADGNFIAFNYDGIYAASGAANTDISHNEFAYNRWGLFVGNSVGTLSMESNVIRDSQRVGLTINNGAAPGNYHNNAIYNNGSSGVRITGATSVRQTLTQNSIYNNGELGIDLAWAGNTELPAPVILAFNQQAGTARGTACANCRIEIFTDQHGEGRWYEGSVTADGSGVWSFSKGSAFTGLEVTATATDAAGNTSEFGQDWPARVPVAPAITSPICGVTNQKQPTFAGVAQMGGMIDLWGNGKDLGGATVSDENTWQITSTSELPDSQHIFTATVETGYGISPATAYTLTVNSSLCYDPVGVTFQQGYVIQHLDDGTGCADPNGALTLRLVPSIPTTVTVPATQGPVTLKVNNVDFPLAAAGDGRYTVSFIPPSGLTVMVLQLPCGNVQINATIDPDGYVYDAEKGLDTKLPGATVTLYYTDTVRSRWVEWPAAVYDQINPQTTAVDGYFSFFVPPGDYQLRVSRPGFIDFQSETITVVDRL
ncbi:MAG TPA: right-handed parallel beta-helix repeat-containing protein, partial [Caldilineaceae bacterium]|nr:right-handed parallel beta-helix repeat-containing protein [Caldilineaceae bacterium]